MTQARFVVSLPAETWLGDVTATFPDATVRVLTALERQSGEVGICWVTAPDVESVLEAIETRGEVTVLSVFEQTSTEAAVHFETSDSCLLRPALEAGVLVSFPIDVSRGDAVIDVTGTANRVTDFGQRLERDHTAFSIEFVREYARASDQLTRNQLSLVAAAVESGYYDTPRRCSLTELASEVGLAKSTVSETLHRAEETIVKSFVRTVETKSSMNQ